MNRIWSDLAIGSDRVWVNGYLDCFVWRGEGESARRCLGLCVSEEGGCVFWKCLVGWKASGGRDGIDGEGDGKCGCSCKSLWNG